MKLYHWIYILLALFFSIYLIAQMSVAKAQGAAACGPRDELISALMNKYQERIAARAVSGRSLIELYKSQSGSWTIIMTTPILISCVIAAGYDWENIESDHRPGKPI